MQRKHNAQLVPFAKQLRREMTKEERHLWYDFLRSYPVRFVKQKVLGQYIADFYCAQAKIIVVDVASIEIVNGSVPSSVKLGQEYDIFGLKVQVTYTDGTFKYLSLSDLTYVSALDTSVAGKQTLTVKYLNSEDTYEVTVVDTGASINGAIFGAMLPDTLIARDTYKGNFKDQDNMYVVGNDNPYILYLNVAVLNANNKLEDVNGEDVPTVVKVYEITGGTRTLLEGDLLSI